jgi:hypothetical protein
MRGEAVLASSKGTVMNERRTLSLLGLMLGSILGACLVLNAIALGDTATADAPATYTD